jgi:hypothetical protein
MLVRLDQRVLPTLGRGKRGEDWAAGQAGKLPLLFIHSRSMSNPEMNVLYGILLSFSSGPKARPIGTRIAGDNPEGHCRCRWVARRPATSAVLSADGHLAQV